MIPRPPIFTIFPYTTLFRSSVEECRFLEQIAGGVAEQAHLGEHGEFRALRLRLLCRSNNARAIAVEIEGRGTQDRKSTRLNSSHANISYAVFCLKKKNKKNN